MNHVLKLPKLISLILLFIGILFSCRKPGDDGPKTPPDDSTNVNVSVNADTIANHLRFFNASKKQGDIPQGPASSSLKISFEDTIYLVDALIPIKFLHEDTTKNVAGAMVQVYVGGSASTYYFDVPELPDVAENDTISTIVVGIETEGLPVGGVPPAGGVPFETTIKIIPYDENGETLGEVIRPVQISPPNTDINGACGLVEGHFIWSFSYTRNGFHNSPQKFWGILGQNIQGCCTNGISEYTSNCAPENIRSLIFRTYYQWPREVWRFFNDGTYVGVSEHITTVPFPDSSNFCGDGPGMVRSNFRVNFPEGKWSVDASGQIHLVGENSEIISTAARPNGKILTLSCKFLVLMQEDPETGDEDDRLVKFYSRNYPGQPRWFPFS